MAKQRGYPDRRGMGAQSDFIAEKFVSSEHYKAQQMAMVQKLIAAGINPEQVAVGSSFHSGYFKLKSQRIRSKTSLERRPTEHVPFN
jgi:hypothetical protein